MPACNYRYVAMYDYFKFNSYPTVLAGENSWCVILETFFLLLYKARSDNIRKKTLAYETEETVTLCSITCTEMKQRSQILQ